MSNGGHVYEVKCPSCGAPLPMAGERITCNYCGSVIERARPAAQEQPPPSGRVESQVVVIQTGYARRSGQAKSGGSSCLAGIFIFLFMVGMFGAVGWFQFREQLATLPGLSQLANLGQLEKIANTVSISSVSRVMLLPNGDGAPPDFLTYIYQSEAETYVLTYVEARSSTIRWQSPPLKEWYAAQVLHSPTALYTTDETRLFAFNRADGQTLWQTSLADKLAPSCLDCFELINNTLVALVQGGTVQGFDARTGQLLWSKRLNFEASSRLLPAGDQLIVFDRTPDNRNNLMIIVDPARGDLVGEITLPECAGEWFDLRHPLFYQPQRSQVYLISGDIIGPACLQIWDIANQTMIEEIVFEGIALPSDFSQSAYEQTRALLAGDQLYFSAQKQAVSGATAGLIVQVNGADGTWQALAPTPDYELIPLARSDNLLIVRAVRSRGTERSELWGLDPASGRPAWQYVIQAGRWFKEPGSEPAWDWHLARPGLAVLQIFGDPDQLTVETLNPQTGVSAGQKTIPLDDNYFTDIIWTGDAAWVALRKIYQVDLQSGAVAYTWP